MSPCNTPPPPSQPNTTHTAQLSHEAEHVSLTVLVTQITVCLQQRHHALDSKAPRSAMPVAELPIHLMGSGIKQLSSSLALEPFC
jgi:hypothetical protein